MEESIINKKKKKITILTISGLFAIVFVLVGVTYAFFNYTRTGSANTIRVGRIAFNTTQGTAINLSNVFPVDVTNGIPNDSNVGSVTINVTGDTTYSGGVEYLVTATNVSNTAGSKQLPISIDVSYSANGTGKTIGTEVTGNTDYFTIRGGNTSYYKVLAENTITGNDNLVVGYIAPGATGIDGNIVIRAYIDAAKVAISDTYNGTASDNMGTTSEWVNNRTVFTTEEWNSLQSDGVSFQIKVEANEGIWVEESNTLYSIMRKNAVMDNISSTYVSASSGINFGKISSNTNGKGIYMRAGTENNRYPIVYYRGDIDNNNVAFAGFCWLAVRSTDTGGVKLIYNGLQDASGTCLPLSGSGESSSEASGESSSEASGESSSEANGEVGGNTRRSGSQTEITLRGINTFKFSEYDYPSPAYVGYMYGDVYTSISGAETSGEYYGSSFTYDGANYTLVDPVTTKNNTHHYTCNLKTAEGTCATIRYYFYANYYVNLTGGDSIERAMEKMQTNTNNSNAKTQIDAWYLTNMNTVTNKLEDTIWCNDRSMGNGNNNGWIANGGELLTYLCYGARERSNWASNSSTVKNQPSLACTNKNDAFTVSNGNGNQKLDYPVALLTEDEIILAGGLVGISSTFYLNNGSSYWSLSPYSFYVDYASGFGVGSSGDLYSDNVGGSFGLRPSVSLKPGTPVISGDGTVSSPYKIVS